MNRSRVTGDLASHGNIFVDIANDRVGIGSTIPAHKLEVRGDTHIYGDLEVESSLGYIRLTDSDSGGDDFGLRNDAGTFFIRDVTHGANRFSINSEGTLRALNRMDFDAGIHLNAGDLRIVDTIKHRDDEDTKIRFPSNDRISFETGGTQAAQIDSNQRLTIGTGGVGNASVYADDIVIDCSGARGITIHTTSTSGARPGCIFFGEGTSIPDYASGVIMFEHNGNYMHFSTSGSTNVGKSLRINNVGDVRFDSTPTSNHAMSVIIKSHKSRVVDDNNGICFLDGGDHTQAVINVQKKSASNASSDLVFRTSSGQVVNTLQGIPERLRIKSDGQLLVGNTASGFTTKLVVGTGSGDNGITVYGGTSNNAYLHFADGNSGSDRYRGYVNYGHSDNSMQFGTNDVERLRISSVGHVTKPFQPAFHARPPAGYSTPNNTDTIIGGTWYTSDSESFVRGTLTNGNSIWDNSTGIFTVPVTGVYYFHLTLFLALNTTRRDALIYHNGTGGGNIIARTEVMGQQGSGNRNVSVSTVVFLSANDTIRFGARNTGNTATLYTSSKPWSYACGYLVS